MPDCPNEAFTVGHCCLLCPAVLFFSPSADAAAWSEPCDALR